VPRPAELVLLRSARADGVPAASSALLLSTFELGSRPADGAAVSALQRGQKALSALLGTEAANLVSFVANPMSDAQPPVAVPVQPGEVLAGKFKVERILGAGGMGVVVAAMHLELDERVAVKFLLPQSIQGPEAAARFVREARNAVKIKGEHVARIIDVGRLENGAPYMVMEYLEGNDLSAQLAKGPLSIEDAVDYVVQACDAMAEAHALNIVHRDLKPANLFLTKRSDGSAIIKVLDFGISKAQVPDTKDAGLTKTSAVMGSPYYMSPEQMKSSRDVDSRTDVWSLGVILFELLSGRPPFQGETLPELLSAIMLDAPPLLHTLRLDAPTELAAVLTRALQKDRTQRYRSVGELAAALAPFAPARSRYTLDRVIRLAGAQQVVPSEPPSGDATAQQSPAGALTASAWSGTEDKPVAKPKRAGLFLALGGIVLLAVVAGTLLGRRSTPAAAEIPVVSAAVVAAAPSVAPSPAPVIAVDPPQPVTAAPATVSVSPSAGPPTAPGLAAPPRAPAARPAAKPSAKPADKPVAAAPAPEPSPLVTPPAQPEAPKPPKRTGLQIDLK
jgi:eukaryotic-like serine/threonine-protein kinase